MKVAIVSDLHANMETLESFPEECDELWVPGDLVRPGPNPAEVVDAVRARASLIVRGNHDQAAGAGDDPRCSEAFRSMAAATLDFACAALAPEQKAWLASLPLTAERTIDGARFFPCHALVAPFGRTATSSFGRMNTLSKRLSGRSWRCRFRMTFGVVSPMCFAQAVIQIAIVQTRRRRHV